MELFIFFGESASTMTQDNFSAVSSCTHWEGLPEQPSRNRGAHFLPYWQSIPRIVDSL